jgi:hypothetical protein
MKRNQFRQLRRSSDLASLMAYLAGSSGSLALAVTHEYLTPEVFNVSCPPASTYRHSRRP